MVDLSDVERYERNLEGPKMNLVHIQKSSEKIPGNIFTTEYDYKTRFYSLYVTDNKEMESSGPIPGPGLAPVFSPSKLHQQQQHHQQLHHLQQQQLNSNPFEKSFENIAMKEEVSLNQFHCVIPIKKNTKLKKSHSETTLEQEVKFDVKLPNKKFSTNFLKGSLLKKESVPSVDSAPHDQLQHPQQQQQYDIPQQQQKQQQKQQRMSHKKKHHQQQHQRNEVEYGEDEGETAISNTTNHSIPSHVIHNRLMGWKLTSPERRKELIELFENIRQEPSQLSNEQQNYEQHPQPQMTEEEYQEALRIAKRQTEAYKETVKRLSKSSQNKLKYSVSERIFHSDYPPTLTSYYTQQHSQNNNNNKKPHHLQPLNSSTTENERENEKSEINDKYSSKWGFNPQILSKPSTPEFQNHIRHTNSLLKNSDRTELLQNGLIVEKVVAKTVENNLKLMRKDLKKDKIVKIVNEPFLKKIVKKNEKKDGS